MQDRQSGIEATAADDARLDALSSYGVLDTPPEQGFDDIVMLAAQTCGTPVALVSLVDRDRQWFKARIGFESCETPLGQSVCAHALKQTDLLVITDLAADPRTADNPLVTGEPRLRFYAGAPLVTPDGEVLGTLCVIDHIARPGGLNPTQRGALEALSRQVMTQLDLRRALAERDVTARARTAEQERARQVLDSAVDFGIVVMDRDGFVTEWNKGAEGIFGWTEDEMRGQRADRFFTPEDRAASRADVEMDLSLRDGRAEDERWHLRKDNSRFWASGEMMPLLDGSGGHAGFVKILRDRTAEHLAGRRLEVAEARLRQAQEAGGIGVFSVDVATGTLSGTPEFCRLYGLDERPERPAEDFEALVVPEDRDLVSTNSTRRAAESPRDVEYRIRRADTGELRWIARKGEFHKDDDGRPVRFLGVARDVTARVQVETELRASEEKWRSLFEQLHEGFLLGSVVRDEAGKVVDWRYEEVNRAWHELMGVPVGAAVGRTVRELIPEVEDEWIAEMAGVVDRNVGSSFTRQVGALGRWYEGAVQPLGDDRFTVIFLDVTERIVSEARRTALAELNDALLEQVEDDALSKSAAAVIGKALGVGRVGYGTIAEDGVTLTVPYDWTAPAFASVAGTHHFDDYGRYSENLVRGETVVIDDVRLDPRTTNNSAALESLSVRTLVNYPTVENGRTVAILYVNDDKPRHWTEEDVAFVGEAATRTRLATERRRAEYALRESEDRRRLAADMGEVGVFDLDLDTRELLWDDRVRAAFGVSSGRPVAQETKLAAVHADDRPEFDRQFVSTLEGGEFDLQFRTVGIEDGILRWVAVKGQVIRKANGSRRFIGAVRDVTERVAAEERRQLLNAELAHRLKNTLAIVSSITTQTLRTAPDMTTARKSLTDRILALSKAHDILLTGQRDAGSIDAIITGALAIHDDGRRVRLKGPRILIGPKAALTLSLIVHELATNAGKYGALSVPDGVVDVIWSVDRHSDTRVPMLAWEWRESGGPPVEVPTRKSFGTRLIQMGLGGSADGGVDLDYAPKGLRCRITAGLTELQRTDES
ncbi:PAS domain S-box protein [Aureimonas sp. AU22]|uniref:PAS domain S-box protein n=1 Tax=Aureimonas sp. AU22 TaxID=1638162 RepID=UPI000785ED67|nr:PAS domain S-box protein [Aureimonas sp. AU22]